MNNSFEEIQVEFNNRAAGIFFNLYKGFQNSVSSIDRQRDENVFQQLQSKYSSLLKQQLEAMAQELINRSKGSQYNGQLKGSLPFMILDYTKEFMQKTRSL